MPISTYGGIVNQWAAYPALNNIVPDADATRDLGSEAKGWNAIWLNNNGESIIYGNPNLKGHVTVSQLSNPGAPTVTNVGTAGATTYTYKVVATVGGKSTAAGSAGSTTTGNATLDGTNFNRLTWTAVPGATNYDIYRTVGGGTTGLIGNADDGADLSFDDTGLAGGGETAPTVNNTGYLALAGAMTFGVAVDAPAGTVVGLHRDNTSDLTLNVPTGYTVNLAVNGVDSIVVGASGVVTGFAGTTSLTLQGGLTQSTQRDIVFKTSNVADALGTTRLTIGSNAADAIITVSQAELRLTHQAAVATMPTLATNMLNLVHTAYSSAGGYEMIGFGYVSGTTNVPASLGYLETNNGGATAGALIFATRLDTNDSAPSERLRIGGGAATTVATWTAITHTGFVATNSITLGTAGSALGTLNIAGNTSGTVSLTVAAAAGTWTMTLPDAANTNAGYQLTCAGANSITSWAAAASLREFKDIEGEHSPQDALDKILGTRVYDFRYKPGMGTLDGQTNYVGVVADEAPWAMHYAGGVVNPINALGYTVLAFQAMQQEIRELRAEVTALKGG